MASRRAGFDKAHASSPDRTRYGFGLEGRFVSAGPTVQKGDLDPSLTRPGQFSCPAAKPRVVCRN